MDQLLKVAQTINFYLSDYILVFLLVGTGLYFTVRTKFVQVRCFAQGWKLMFGNFSLNGGRQQGGLNSFQALSTAVAAQVGTGNLIGASGAILAGGPGAIFWMWIIAFFGMATIYAEAVVAQETRVVEKDGTVSGGPAYYIRRAFPNRLGNFLAAFFGIAIILALGFMGSMVQSNSIAQTCNHAFGIPVWSVGLAVAAVASFVFIGGISRIAAVTEKLVPFMAVLYVIGCLVVIIARMEFIPETLAMIIRYAFQPEAIIGGGFGTALKIAISQGVKRGLFSNEAGMGSTPHAHAMAKVKCPHDQGVVAMVGVFIDTFVVLTLTAIVVICTLYAGNGPLADGAEMGIDKSNMAQLAFTDVFGQAAGNAFIAVCLLCFAFSTILGWNFFGKINANFLFGKKGVLLYSIVAILFIFAGSCLSNDLVWECADLFNQLMVLPNVIALVALAGLVVKNACPEEKATETKAMETKKP